MPGIGGIGTGMPPAGGPADSASKEAIAFPGVVAYTKDAFAGSASTSALVAQKDPDSVVPYQQNSDELEKAPPRLAAGRCR